MRTFCVALVLIAVAISPATAEFLIAPDGAIAPDGRLTYAVPSGIGFGPVGLTPPMLGPMPPTGLTYPVYYPDLWVPALIPADSLDQRMTGGQPRQR
jgi:hypothetical protein